jgi:hypothetical protein
VYSEKLLMMDELSETCRASFQEYICEISASSWFYYKKQFKDHAMRWTVCGSIPGREIISSAKRPYGL